MKYNNKEKLIHSRTYRKSLRTLWSQKQREQSCDLRSFNPSFKHFSLMICILCINKFIQIEVTYSLKHLNKLCLPKLCTLYMGFRRIFRRNTRRKKNILFLFKFLIDDLWWLTTILWLCRSKFVLRLCLLMQLDQICRIQSKANWTKYFHAHYGYMYVFKMIAN